MLTVLGPVRDPGMRSNMWLVRCDCGVEKLVQQGHLASRKSCGCIQRDPVANAARLKKSTATIRKKAATRAAFTGTHKKCTKCFLDLPLDRFPKHTRGLGGHISHCKACIAARNRAKEYGVSYEEQKELLDVQAEVCPICELDLAGDLNLDHDHSTGAVRAFVHTHCNFLIGLYEKSRSTLSKSGRWTKLETYLRLPPFRLVK